MKNKKKIFIIILMIFMLCGCTKVLKDENNKVEIELNFEAYYGIIEDGHYRIVKEINDKDIAVEFDLITLKDN